MAEVKVRLTKPVFIFGRLHAPGEEIEVPESLFSVKAMERLGETPAAAAPDAEKTTEPELQDKGEAADPPPHKPKRKRKD